MVLVQGPPGCRHLRESVFAVTKSQEETTKNELDWNTHGIIANIA